MKRDTHVQAPGENVKPTKRVSRRFIDISVCNDLRDLTDEALQVETVPGNSRFASGGGCYPYSVCYLHDIYCALIL